MALRESLPESGRYLIRDGRTKLVHVAMMYAESSYTDVLYVHATACNIDVVSGWTLVKGEPVTCLVCLVDGGFDGARQYTQKF